MKLFSALLFSTLALAQHHDSPPAENPVALYKGLGVWHHPTATSNPEAQKFFDQGLALLFSFNRYESLRSFRKASELDPRSVMPYWGMAMAQGPYINMDGDPSFDLKGACAAVEAGSKISNAPDRERAYLQAVSTWCPEYKPPAYIDAMRALVGRYPDDLDARTIYAESLMIPVRWHWYSSDGTAAPGVSEAERQLEEVLRRWPDHPGANHYYIHAVESSPTPERAVASAQRLMGLVPAAGHMVHMPGHIWLVLGDWKMAGDVNERAAEVDRQYFAASNVVGGSYAPYYGHNLHFIMYARTMEGRRADSLSASATLAEVLAPLAQAMPEMADMFVPIPSFAYMRFGEWDRLLQAAAPKPEMKLSTAFWHYGRALALCAKADPSAPAARAAFLKARDAVPSDAVFGQNKASEVLAIASESLEARLAASPEASLPHWRRAVELQDALTYDEPPGWYYPLRESLGAALLRARQAAEAETVFREGVRRSPRNGRMLFGLMRSLTAQGKTEAASSVQREFDAAWSKADIQLSIDTM